MRAVSSTMGFFEEHEEEGQEEAMQVDGETAGRPRQFSEPLGYVCRVLFLPQLCLQDRDPHCL